MRLLEYLTSLLAQSAQSPVTNIVSKSIPGASITYKKTTACNASTNTLSYSGYVHMNSTVIPGFAHNTSTFFWFFPARQPVGANLTLYLAGGPGEASTFAALTENGPCSVSKDGKTVVPNPYSFNEYAHVLYVDQPNQVGFSYDKIVDGIFDALGGNSGSGSGEYTIGTGETTSLTKIKGKFPSQNADATAKTSTMAAKNMWYFLQVFLADFDVNYGTKNSVSIWGNSYGGMYTAALASYILRTSSRLSTKSTSKKIDVPTVGITNGCVDVEAQILAYASFPYNNTYDNPDGTPFRLYNKTTYSNLVATAHRPDGCFESVRQCRSTKALYDPNDEATDPRVVSACTTALETCNGDILFPYFLVASPRSQYDISLPYAQPWPPKYAATYLNNPLTRAALGVPTGLNYTLFASIVNSNFFSSGDPMRAGGADLAYLLDRNTRVAMVYGDRDWRCNWVGAENLTNTLGWGSKGNFSRAGYVEVKLASGKQTAVAKQHSRLSFTRVFQAGHAVGWYAPETVQTIFTRTLHGLDVSTGTRPAALTATKGKSSAWGWRSKFPSVNVPTECSLWNFGDSCSAAQEAALRNGSAGVDATWLVVEPKV